MCESVGSASRTVHLLQVYIPLSHEMCIPREQQHTAGIMWPKRMLEHHGGEPTAPWLTAAFYFRKLIRRCAARAERASKHYQARDACLQAPQADFSPQITALQILSTHAYCCCCSCQMHCPRLCRGTRHSRGQDGDPAPQRTCDQTRIRHAPRQH